MNVLTVQYVHDVASVMKTQYNEWSNELHSLSKHLHRLKCPYFLTKSSATVTPF